MTERKEFGHLIAVPLSDEEIAVKSAEIIELDKKMLKIDAEKAVAMQGYNADLKSAKAARNALIGVVDARAEKREIQVYEEPDERGEKMLTRRCDNGVVVEERDLTQDEVDESRQPELPLGEAGASSSDGPGDDEDSEESDDADLSNVLDEYEAQQGAAAVAGETAAEEVVSVSGGDEDAAGPKARRSRKVH